MSGEPIEAVRNGLKTLHSALRKDPQAVETAYISVITFDSTATQVVPLTEVASFRPPNINSTGLTAMGEALSLVSDCAAREVNQGTAEEKGDWKPLVFLLTDGMPTDDINKGLNKFKSIKWGMVLACAAGRDAVDVELLKRIAGENVVFLDVCNSSTLSAYFKFLSKSISVSSKKIDGGEEVNSLSQLPPLPEEISLLKL
jgi:uncharacterized protein YegL